MKEINNYKNSVALLYSHQLAMLHRHHFKNHWYTKHLKFHHYRQKVQETMRLPMADTLTWRSKSLKGIGSCVVSDLIPGEENTLLWQQSLKKDSRMGLMLNWPEKSSGDLYTRPEGNRVYEYVFSLFLSFLLCSCYMNGRSRCTETAGQCLRACCFPHPLLSLSTHS